MGTTRKDRRYELPEEVLAVLECCPNLEPFENSATPTSILSQST
jgi:hypothetical protein